MSAGKPAKRKFMMRAEGSNDKYVDSSTRCGVDITPDFIQSCFYTDCFKKTSAYRRRMAGALMAATPDCDIKPKYKQPRAYGAYSAAGYATSTCKPGTYIKSRPVDPIKGDNVCHYRQPEPTDGNKACYCRTLVCTVITNEDKKWTGYASDGKSTQGTADKETACNFIVRIEDAHGSPKVPGYAMWLLFGIAACIALSTSVIFMIIYGSEETHGHGHGHGHGEAEKEHGHGSKE